MMHCLIKTPPRILVLDEEEFMCKAVKTVLEYMGYEVSVATNGLEAIDKYQESIEVCQPYDVAIVELKENGFSGQKVAQKILDIHPLARLVICSGWGEDCPIVANYKDYGFKGRLIKPYLLTDLEDTLQQALSA